MAAAGYDLLLCRMVAEVVRWPRVLHPEVVTPVAVEAEGV